MIDDKEEKEKDRSFVKLFLNIVNFPIQLTIVCVLLILSIYAGFTFEFAVDAGDDLELCEGEPALLYGTGAVHLTPDNKITRIGGVQYTVKDGIVYDAKKLLRDVKNMVDVEKKKTNWQLKQPGVE